MQVTDHSKKRKILRDAMQQLFERRYKTTLYNLEFGKSVVRTYTPEKSFGSILSVLVSPLILCRY
jgi:hypothetical protein